LKTNEKSIDARSLSIKKKLNGTKNKNNNLIYLARRKKKFLKTPSFKEKRSNPRSLQEYSKSKE
jgi:hypothetical protein